MSLGSSVEHQCVEAARRFLELERDEPCILVKRPDEDERSRKAVDAELRLGDTMLVLEHTELAALESEQRLRPLLNLLHSELLERLEGHLPPGSFHCLLLDPARLREATRRSLHERLDSAADEIVGRAAGISMSLPGSSAGRRGVIECDPVYGTLQRWPARLDGRRFGIRVQVAHPRENFEAELGRVQREKLPKLLEAAASASGATETCLVLQVDNFAIVAEDEAKTQFNGALEADGIDHLLMAVLYPTELDVIDCRSGHSQCFDRTDLASAS